ncbi:hypothetical protein MP228_002889 [Amoeboaphelidium protococcarum]|nr:hypothetical protein MP228_002889 [Amoeboaphelidium protococcarum]
MCGIIGSILADTSQNVSVELYEGLSVLQHRGQDAAGIVTCAQKGRLYQCKGNGLVKDVFAEDQLIRLAGYHGVGHCRYPTAGGSSQSEAQPFYVNSPYGIVLAHNGNLTNTVELRQYLDTKAHRHINTDSDSECLLNVFAECLSQAGKVRVNEDDVFRAIEGVMNRCTGGYACVAMIPSFGIIAFRDRFGIRPIVYGSRQSRTLDHGTDYMVASESVVLDVLGYNTDDVKDLLPGQAIIITREKMTLRQCVPVDPTYVSPCIFEYVYFARPDSIMNGISVYKARLAMGELLAKQVVKHFKDKLGQDVRNAVDVIIPVPDTSRTAALQLSYQLGITYREGFIKNRYIGRTFIMPGQSQRKKNVRRKLNPMKMEFQDKRVLLVDDSVVRGTTSKEIIMMARESGASKVYFASCAPAIRYPNVYGIDMPTRNELVAFDKSEDEVAQIIGADDLIYQDLDDLVEACKRYNPAIQQFDVSVFNGEYVTGDVDDEYFAHLEQVRRRFNSTVLNTTVQISAANGKKQNGNHNGSVQSVITSPAHSEESMNEVSSPVQLIQPSLQLKGGQDNIALHNSYKSDRMDLNTSPE